MNNTRSDTQAFYPAGNEHDQLATPSDPLNALHHSPQAINMLGIGSNDRNVTDYDPNPPVFQSLQELGQPSGNFIDPGNLFTFDGAFDFPIISNSMFPPPLGQAPMIQPYLSADLEALMGAQFTTDFTNGPALDPIINLEQMNYTGVVAAIDHSPFTPSSGFQTAEGGQDSAGQRVRQLSISNFEAATASHAISTMNGTAPVDSIRQTGNKQALLDSICQLVQLATTMQ